MAAINADALRVESPISGTERTLSFETGRLAGLADGAVVGRIGDTVVLVTATAARHVRDGVDFFPLTVDIEERMYAAGKIPGSFFRREGRAPDQAILVCRLIDRPLRPSFPEGFRNEVHVVGTVMGADQENPHDVLAINAASAALMISGIPFEGPIGAVRVAYSAEGAWLPHPSWTEGDASSFEMVVAGSLTADGNDISIMMVEAGGTEASWENYCDGAPKVTEAVIAEGLEVAKKWIRESIDLQLELVEKVGDITPIPFTPQLDYTDAQFAAIDAAGREAITAAMSIADKADRLAAESAAVAAAIEATLPQFADEPNAAKQLKAAARSLTKKIVRKRIVDEGFRIDGRGTRDVRPLSSEVALIPTAHGSGLFQRGETQVLNITTLGMPRMDQMLDTITPDESKRYMHHYNFPPFSTGETGFMRGPKRREIGHGLLAERALLPVIPKLAEFPYALRLVSEVLSSNGSTSMGSVCSSTLSLMDAGVPIKAPVAGIAMGLVHAEGKYTTLTDILGAEDAFGDMDFKVAGTAEFVTALQLDTKLEEGIPADVLAQALQQAYEARTQILDVMLKAIAQPRPEVGETAPKIISIVIPGDKIGEVIGPKGKVINELQAETGTDIAVEDKDGQGVVTIGGRDKAMLDEARRRVELIANPPLAEVGAIYQGRVVNVTKFGAFVNILPGRDGLVHISKLGGGKRIDRVEDVLNLGDAIEVRVDDIDPSGKVSLSPAGELPVSEGSGGGGPAGATASFEDSFDAEVRETYGELGPDSGGLGGDDRPRDRDRGGDRGGDRGRRGPRRR